MQIDNTNKTTIEQMSLLTGLYNSKVKEVFESLVTVIMLNYLDGESTHIPFLGDVTVKHVDDELTQNGKRAVLDVDIVPSSTLTKNVGQAADGDELEIENKYKIRMQNALKERLNA